MRVVGDLLLSSRNTVLLAVVGLIGCFTEVDHTGWGDSSAGGGGGINEVGGMGGAMGGAEAGLVDAPIGGGGAGGAIDGRGSGGVIGTGSSSLGVDGPMASGGTTSASGGIGGLVATGGSTSAKGGTDGGSVSTGGALTADAPVDQKSSGGVGAACTRNSDCDLGNCANGVCCATTCGGCNACAGKMTGKQDGTCAPALAGSDPNEACADETTVLPCGNDGTCDGAGACQKAGKGTACKQAVCNESVLTPAYTCDGLGTCKAPLPQDCSPYQCATSGCLKSCAQQEDCGGGNYCKITSGTTGTCTLKNPNGTPATQEFECLSNIVADGVCCDNDCTGCKACSGAPLTAGAAGKCSNVLAGKVAHNACTASGVTCGLDGMCDGTGACRYSPAEGASCDDPANLCVTGRVCLSHTCTAGTTRTCPAPTQKCRKPGVCDPSSGSCTYGLAADNTDCDDGNACTQNDLCQGGTCSGSQKLCNSPPACKLSTTCSAGACNYSQNAEDGTADPKCNGLYCYAGSCVRCLSDPQCSGVRPSCDLSSHTCVCRRPSAGNLLTNPGFDAALSAWGETCSVATTVASDSEGCAESNSVYDDCGSVDLRQCFPVTAGASYNVGGKFKGGFPGCGFRVNFYSGSGCSGSESAVVWSFDIPVLQDWTWESSVMQVPAGAMSAKIGILGQTLYLDQLYVNATANQF